MADRTSGEGEAEVVGSAFMNFDGAFVHDFTFNANGTVKDWLKTPGGAGTHNPHDSSTAETAADTTAAGPEQTR